MKQKRRVQGKEDEKDVRKNRYECKKKSTMKRRREKDTMKRKDDRKQKDKRK